MPKHFAQLESKFLCGSGHSFPLMSFVESLFVRNLTLAIAVVSVEVGESHNMNDNTGPPGAARWRALARDRHAIADEMTDAEAKHLMRQLQTATNGWRCMRQAGKQFLWQRRSTPHRSQEHSDGFRKRVFGHST